MSLGNFSGNLKNFFNPQKIINFGGRIWRDYSQLFFIFFSLFLVSYGVYFWHKSVYQSEWNADEKNQYKSSQNKEIEFKAKNFEKVINEIERKKTIYNGSSYLVKDIFKSYEKIEKDNQTTNENNSTKVSQPGSNKSVVNPAPIIPR